MPDVSLDDPRRATEIVLSSMMENAAVLALAIDPLATLSGRVRRPVEPEANPRASGVASADRICIRILVEDEASCYRVVFVVHQRFAHDPLAYRDYIRAPRENGERSIRTTVFDDQQRPVELRVRTRTMYDCGEHGEYTRRTSDVRWVSTASLSSPDGGGRQAVPTSIQRAIVEMAAARASGDRVLARLVAAALLGAGRDGAVLIESEVGAVLHSLEISRSPSPGDAPALLAEADVHHDDVASRRFGHVRSVSLAEGSITLTGSRPPGESRGVAVLRVAVASQGESVAAVARAHAALWAACGAAQEMGADDMAWRGVPLPAANHEGGPA